MTMNDSASQLNNNLDKEIENIFQLRALKQAQEVTCSDEDHPPIYFNNIPVTQITKNILGCILMKNVKPM